MLRAQPIAVALATTLYSIMFLSDVVAGPYAPAAGQVGSTAIAYNDPSIGGWATSVEQLTRGPLNIANPGLGLASHGDPSNALGPAGTDASHVVSLGDGGSITLQFEVAIRNGAGYDFAVFENGFADTFLELAFVEVSSDGDHFFRFPAVSLTQSATQVGGFDPIDPTDLDNLAGKYQSSYGTPFDLSALVGVSPLLNVDDIRYVRVIDAIGTIDPTWASVDSLGQLVNEPWPTPFASGGFDLDGVAVMHQAPEPAGWLLATLACVLGISLRRQLPS